MATFLNTLSNVFTLAFIVPAAVFLLSRRIPLTTDVQIGVILLGTAAGAPFLPKLAQIAKGNVAFAVGLMKRRMQPTVSKV